MDSRRESLVNDYPGLAYLHGGYLHQDFNCEFSSPEDAVRTFAKEELPERVRPVADEVSRLLQDERFRDSPESTLEALGSYYLPTADGLSYAEWLMQVREIIQGG